MSAQHTDTPWAIYTDSRGRIVGTAPGIEAADMSIVCFGDVVDGFSGVRGDGDPGIALANARRIVECVNACEGIADPSVVPELVEALLQALEALTSISKTATREAIKRVDAVLAKAGAA